MSAAKSQPLPGEALGMVETPRIRRHGRGDRRDASERSRSRTASIFCQLAKVDAGLVTGHRSWRRRVRRSRAPTPAPPPRARSASSRRARHSRRDWLRDILRDRFVRNLHHEEREEVEDLRKVPCKRFKNADSFVKGHLLARKLAESFFACPHRRHATVPPEKQAISDKPSLCISSWCRCLRVEDHRTCRTADRATAGGSRAGRRGRRRARRRARRPCLE